MYPNIPIPGLQIVASANNRAGVASLNYLVEEKTPATDCVWRFGIFDENSAAYNKVTFGFKVNGVGYSYNIALFQLRIENYFADNLANAFPFLSAIRTSITNEKFYFDIKSTTENFVITDLSVVFDAAIPQATKDNPPVLTHLSDIAPVTYHTPKLLYKSPSDTAYGAPEILTTEGVVVLKSANGLAELSVNVSLSLLTTISQQVDFEFSTSELVESNKWSFRRRSNSTVQLPASIQIEFENGQIATVSTGQKTTEWFIVSTNELTVPARLKVDLSEDSGTVFVAYGDTRVDYARVNYSNNEFLDVVNNNAPRLKNQRDEAIARIRNGNYSGDVVDALATICLDDNQRFMIQSMLEAGSDYEELVRADVATMLATQALAIWYTVPNPNQVQQSELIAKMAQLRNMSDEQTLAFLQWAVTNNVNIPLADVRKAIATPYDPNTSQSIATYLETMQ